jgi:D-aminopeptidase
MVLVTDAPLLDRNLRRLAARALAGLARTGSSMSNGSGDFVLAFATHPSVRRPLRRPLAPDSAALRRNELTNDELSPRFEAAIVATGGRSAYLSL